MIAPPPVPPAPAKAGAAAAFTPKLISVLREGYGLRELKADALAGLTVAVVALPLSMAIAIGSGAKPEAGLFAAIAGGFLISLLGGSRYQIGGPAGAFIVVVAAAIEQHGYDGFLLATTMSGLLLALAGLLRLGNLIRHIPHAVVTGFTAGIAVIIFAGQLRDLLGLELAHEPSALPQKIAALWEARQSFGPQAALLSLLAIGLILALRQWRPRFPGLLAAVGLGGLAVWALGVPVATIGSRFGGIPHGLPWPALPAFSLARIVEVLPAALSFTVLGGIESLLSAVVADGMTGRSHRSNIELIAQGVANVGSAVFGGICVTGTIARTATNVRAHAHGPVAGLLHAVFLLAFMLVAAPLASYIPMPVLAAILAVVCWNMADRAECAAILRGGGRDALVLAVTFVIVVASGVIAGIAAGVLLALALERLQRHRAA